MRSIEVGNEKKTNVPLTVAVSVVTGILIGLIISGAFYLKPRAKAIGVCASAVNSHYKTVETWKFKELRTKGTFTVVSRSIK